MKAFKRETKCLEFNCLSNFCIRKPTQKVAYVKLCQNHVDFLKLHKSEISVNVINVDTKMELDFKSLLQKSLFS